MKILFLTGRINQIGGVERVTLDLANSFAEEGEKVYIISYSKSTQTEQFPLLSKFSIDYIYEKPVTIRYSFLKGHLLKKKIKNLQPDIIIYVDSFLYLFFRPYISKKYKQVVWEHLNYTVTYGLFLRTLARRLAARYADACVLLTKADAALWRENCRCRAKIISISNPVREDVLRNSRNLIPISERKKQVLCVGRLEYQKDISELIDIWSEIEPNFPEWTLTIVGEGTERKFIEEKINNYKLKNVKLVGRIFDVSSFFAESQILVLTSRFEGLPLVLIEGLFFGLAEISYDCPMGPGEIIEDSRNGYLVQNSNKKLFIQRLSETMKNDDLRKQFSDYAVEHASKYLPETISQQWINLFKNIR